jgi:hypothetical protein
MLEELETGCRRVADYQPPWLRMLVFHSGRAFLTVGHKHPKSIHMPYLEFACVVETCRLGHKLHTNVNKMGREGRAYVKLTFLHRPKDNMPLRRFLFGADEGAAVKALEIESDHSATNSYFVPDGHSRKHARSTAMVNIKRLLKEGAAPAGFDEGAYLANLESLYAALDAKIEGGDL